MVVKLLLKAQFTKPGRRGQTLNKSCCKRKLDGIYITRNINKTSNDFQLSEINAVNSHLNNLKHTCGKLKK